LEGCQARRFWAVLLGQVSWQLNLQPIPFNNKEVLLSLALVSNVQGIQLKVAARPEIVGIS